MTHISIDEQVEILKTTTERVGVSPEAASAFLHSAGIYTVGDGLARKETVHFKHSNKTAAISKTHKK
jgi:hypothetical protein